MTPRIYGMESELPLAFVPDPGYRGAHPSRRDLYERVVEALREQVETLPALARKEQAYALENGSIVHYEYQPRHASGGVLEWATAECPDPLQLLAQSKAQERALLAALPVASERLRDAGFAGQVEALRNNADPWGNNWGCHESYSVDDRLPAWRARGRAAALVAFWLAFFPLYLLPHLLQLGVLLLLLAVLVVYLLLGLLGRVPRIGRPAAWLTGAFERWLTEHGQALDDGVQRWLTTVLEWLFLPFVWLYSGLCRRLVLRRHAGPVATCMVTRQIFAGAGWLQPTADGALFWLSQKAPHVDGVLRVFWNEAGKPLIDVKELLLEPAAAFRASRRLHLIGGDANLCEVAELLKVGVMGLVLELVEAGVEELPELADPVAAMGEVARDLTLSRPLPLRGGGEASAREIQRRLLAAVQAHLASSAVRPLWAARVVALWEEVLDRLEAPESLSAELDWVAKRQLMSQLVWQRSSWAELEAWAPALALLVREGPPPDDALPDAHLSGRQRAELDRRLAGLERRRMGELVDLYWALKKIDLRYHELSDAGYHRALAREGLIRRVLDDEIVERATVEPPSGTRARVRGEFVKLASGRNMTAYAGWTRLKAYHPRRVVRLGDPFDAEVSRLGCFTGDGQGAPSGGHPGV